MSQDDTGRFGPGMRVMHRFWQGVIAVANTNPVPPAWDATFLRWQGVLAASWQRQVAPRLRRARSFTGRILVPAALHAASLTLGMLSVAMWGVPSDWLSSGGLVLGIAVTAILVTALRGWRSRWAARDRWVAWRSAGWMFMYMLAVTRAGLLVGAARLGTAIRDQRAAGYPVSFAELGDDERSPNNAAPAFERWCVRWSRTGSGGRPAEAEVVAAIRGAGPGSTPATRLAARYRLDALHRRHKDYFTSAMRDLAPLFAPGRAYISSGTTASAARPFDPDVAEMRLWRAWYPIRAVAIRAALHGDARAAWRAVGLLVDCAWVAGDAAGSFTGIEGAMALERSALLAADVLRLTGDAPIPPEVVARLPDSASPFWAFRQGILESARFLDCWRWLRDGVRPATWPPPDLEDRLWVWFASWSGGDMNTWVDPIIRNLENARIPELSPGSLRRWRERTPRWARWSVEYEVEARLRWRCVVTAAAVMAERRHAGRWPASVDVLHPGSVPAEHHRDYWADAPLRLRLYPGGTGFVVSSAGPDGDGKGWQGRPLELGFP